MEGHSTGQVVSTGDTYVVGRTTYTYADPARAPEAILTVRTGILARQEVEAMRTGLDLLLRIIAVGLCVLVLLFAAQGLESDAVSGGTDPSVGAAMEAAGR